MTMLTVHLLAHGKHHEVSYKSVDECLADEPLAKLLDTTNAECVLWAGRLRITGRSIRSSRELREALVSNASTILRGVI